MTDLTNSTTTPVVVSGKAAKPPRPRRMARPAADEVVPAVRPDVVPPVAKVSKLAAVEALLRRAGGASIAELVAATGWQKYSVRGAMAGALKKRGLVITSNKADGVRRYQAGDAA